VADVIAVFESMRVARPFVKEALVSLINAELVECDSWTVSEDFEANLFNPSHPELSDDYHIKISATGYYYLHSLAKNELYVALCSQDSYWYSDSAYDQYIAEFKTFIELAKDDPRLDFLTGTKCVEIWRNYLGVERYFEEKLRNDNIDPTWWRLAFESIELVTPVPSEPTALPKVKRKKSEPEQPPLWEEPIAEVVQ
jgi:hypothetical protein